MLRLILYTNYKPSGILVRVVAMASGKKGEIPYPFLLLQN